MLPQDIISSRWLIDEIFRSGITNPVAIAAELAKEQNLRRAQSKLPPLTNDRIVRYLKGRSKAGLLRTGWDAILHREFTDDEALVLGFQSGFFRDDESAVLAGFITDAGEIADLSGLPKPVVELIQRHIGEKLHKFKALYVTPANEATGNGHHTLSAAQIGRYLAVAKAVELEDVTDADLMTTEDAPTRVPVDRWFESYLPAVLKPKEILVIRAKFGLGIEAINADEEIARATGIERSTVTKLRNRAEKKLASRGVRELQQVMFGEEMCTA